MADETCPEGVNEYQWRACHELLPMDDGAVKAFQARQLRLLNDPKWPLLGWYNDRDFCRAVNSAIHMRRQLSQRDEQLATARKTNARLNRRCQKLESMFKRHDLYGYVYSELERRGREWEETYWKRRTSRLGERAAKVKRELATAKADLENAQEEAAHAPDAVWDHLRREGIEFYELGPDDDPPSDMTDEQAEEMANKTRRIFFAEDKGDPSVGLDGTSWWQTTDGEYCKAKAENARLRAGRKRYYACRAGIFEGELNHVQLDKNWIVAEESCYLTCEEAEAAEAGKETT